MTAARTRARAERPARRLIDPRVLAQLDNLELVARTVVDGALTGLHRSPKFGFSQEFAEYRTYSPGDDLRFIDWNVLARTDRLYIKRFFGSTNTALVVMVDASASMGALGDDSAMPAKLDYARFVAAALTHLAARQHDAVGYLAFDATVRDYRPPSARALAVQQIYHLLDELQPGGATDWDAALTHVGGRVRTRSLMVLISDFYCAPQALGQGLGALIARGHDVLAVHVLTPEERHPDVGGSATLRDIETGRVMEVSPQEIGTAYPRRLADHVAAVRAACVSAGGHHLRIDTDQPLDAALASYLRFRARHP